jgi:dUTP pyrophosphatase
VDNVRIDVEVMPHARGLSLPRPATAGAAGADVCAAVTDPLVLAPMGRAAVPTGLRLAIPPGYEIQVRPRSGLALRHAVTVLNAPGTIDSDYRGELKVLLVNLGAEPFVIERGARIAQLVLARAEQPAWREVDAVDESQRGGGGFGHTGLH